VQTDSNPDCTWCSGEGEVYKYFASHKHKIVIMDWQYCVVCFPFSSGSWIDSLDDDLVEIDGYEFDRLQKEEKYHEM